MAKNRPKAWTERPVLLPQNMIAMRAGNDLASSRTENCIPFLAVHEYAKILNLDTFWLLDRIQVIDREVLAYHERQRNQTSGV